MTPIEKRAQELVLRHVMPELEALASRAGEYATTRQTSKDELVAWLIAEMRRALERGRAKIDATGEVVPVLDAADLIESCRGFEPGPAVPAEAPEPRYRFTCKRFEALDRIHLAHHATQDGRRVA